jgi:hypothetical protein
MVANKRTFPDGFLAICCGRSVVQEQKPEAKGVISQKRDVMAPQQYIKREVW